MNVKLEKLLNAR